MHAKIISIAKRLKRRYLGITYAQNRYSIFLCGGAGPAENRLRNSIRQRISTIRSKYKYSAYYPEDYFDELLRSHRQQNLLRLENILAKSVHAVVILLHSAGTLTELGVFSNHQELRQKLIVVMDPKHRKARSFVTMGPVKLIEKVNKNRVIPLQMVTANANDITMRIIESTRTIPSSVMPVRDLTNPVIASDFYLALCYVFDPIPVDVVIGLADILEPGKKAASDVAQAAINRLVSQRLISVVGGQIRLSTKGVETAAILHDNRRSAKKERVLLEELRIGALNFMLRGRTKRRAKIWSGIGAS
ncbi:retron St85 family effector protein [Elusimicrobiota bacterium]